MFDDAGRMWVEAAVEVSPEGAAPVEPKPKARKKKAKPSGPSAGTVIRDAVAILNAARSMASVVSPGLTGAPAGIADLGGRVDTRLAHLGLTSRPSAKLSLLARLRYEDRDDRTPLAAYNVEDTATYTNRHLPSTRLRGQLQASYQFSADYRGTLGAEHESIDDRCIELRPVDQLTNRHRPELDRAHMSQRGARTGERCSTACHDGYAYGHVPSLPEFRRSWRFHPSAASRRPRVCACLDACAAA